MKKILFTVLLFLPFTLVAQEGATFQDEFAGSLQFNSGRVAQLADAIPAEKYKWKPSEEVRSCGEVIGHVTSANYFFSMMLGFPAEGVDPQSFEQTEMTKEEAIENLKASYDQLIKACKSISDEALGEMVSFQEGGMQFSKRSVMFIAMGHVHEHMGQLIAYARSNDIAPPWSVQE